VVAQVLNSDKSSDRTKEGVLLALTYMKDPAAGSPSRELLNGAIKANASSSEDLRFAARHYFAAWASASFEDRLTAERRAALNTENSGANPSPDSSQISLAELEVLYNLGIREKDAYGGSTHDISHFNHGVADFTEAWDLARGVPSSDRVFFAKALYGWGLALHDRSWIQLDENHRRDSELVKQAQAKFQQFLTEVQKSGNPTSYPYPEHLKRAKQYLTDPSPQSLV
jgi:hypothetical protein